MQQSPLWAAQLINTFYQKYPFSEREEEYKRENKNILAIFYTELIYILDSHWQKGEILDRIEDAGKIKSFHRIEDAGKIKSFHRIEDAGKIKSFHRIEASPDQVDEISPRNFNLEDRIVIAQTLGSQFSVKGIPFIQLIPSEVRQTHALIIRLLTSAFPAMIRHYRCSKVIQCLLHSFVALVTKKKKTYCLKAKIIRPTTASNNSFEDEVTIYRQMAELRISPKFVDYYVVESAGAKIGVLITQAYPDPVTSINPTINKLISRMHAAGVVHGDLHLRNIVCKGTKYRIIDYEMSFYTDKIPTGRINNLYKGRNFDSTIQEIQEAEVNIF